MTIWLIRSDHEDSSHSRPTIYLEYLLIAAKVGSIYSFLPLN